MDELIKYIQNNVFLLKTHNNLFNQYNECNSEYDRDNGHIIRQNNLIAYIRQLSLPIEVMFVGIAPGYKGCRFSGVPFTSEQVLLGWKESNFFTHKNYLQSSRFGPYTEISATKIWTSFSTLLPKDKLSHIFMWNIIPFHPYEENKPLSNRDPSIAELNEYEKIILDIIDILNIDYERIGCFGDIPQNHLSRKLSRNLEHINHPSRASYETLKDAYKKLGLIP